MSLLYRVEDEIAIEMSRETWEIVELVVRDAVLAELFPASSKGYGAAQFSELDGFTDAIRSHLQHLEAEKPAPPPSNNLDLI